MRLEIENSGCMSCGQCEEICSNKAIAVDLNRLGNGYRPFFIDQKKCTACKKCISTFSCPGNAIKLIEDEKKS